MVAIQPIEGDEVIHRLRVSEYLRLAELSSWPRTELLQGVIYDMPSESRLHALAVRALYRALVNAFPADEVLFSGSVVATQDSMPMPDVYVERGRRVGTGAYSLAEDLLLVVEVSVSSQARDLGTKRELYAEADIPEYWVVVPRGATSHLLRHTRPDPDKREYASIERIELPGGVEALDVAVIRR